MLLSEQEDKAASADVMTREMRRESQRMVEEGKAAPDFELTSDKGERVKLSDFRDKPVVPLLPSQGRHVLG
jgi:hypothetical protein